MHTSAHKVHTFVMQRPDPRVLGLGASYQHMSYNDILFMITVIIIFDMCYFHSVCLRWIEHILVIVTN